MIQIKCFFCEKEFSKSVNQYNFALKNKKRLFCSLSCSAKFNAQSLKKDAEKRKISYNLNPIKCIFCCQPIPYKYKTSQKFCSQSCAAKISNSNRKVEKNCFICDKTTKNKKFCSTECSNVHRKNKRNQLIEQGFKVKDKTFKNFLIEKKGHKCEMCGLDKWGDKPILLILDHIDGNADNISLDNLRLICSNCDTLTPTYKGRNRGKGRYLRRLKYKKN